MLTKKRRMETDDIPGDPTPISFQTCRRHEWLTRWNSGVTVKWINYYRPLSYITSSILYEPIDLIPINAPRQRPDIARNKIWNQLINHNVFRKTAQMKQLYRDHPTAVTAIWHADVAWPPSENISFWLRIVEFLYFILVALWLRETCQICCFISFSWQGMREIAWNLLCWCTLNTFKTD